MTLQIVDICQYGIICAADSAISFMRKDKVFKQESWNKLLVLERLNAVIGYYGHAQIDGQRMPDWIRAFMRQAKSKSLDEFSVELQDKLNQINTNSSDSDGTGFHLAGYVTEGDVPVPCFYHIWNHGGVVNNYTMTGNGFISSQDFPDRDALDFFPERSEDFFRMKWSVVYRNGALQPYIELADYLYTFVMGFWDKWPNRKPNNLTNWAWYYRFQLESVKLMYRFLVRAPFPPVGRRIDVITLDPTGQIQYLPNQPGN